MIPAPAIIDRISAHQPNVTTPRPSRQAEVALILDTGFSLEDPQIVFIQRALCVDDPWSGQMAFPGGRREHGDRSPADAAKRETLEEIGLDLANGQLVGRLDDLKGRHGGRSRNMLISCFVYAVDGAAPFTLNCEVAEVVSLSVSTLLNPDLWTRVPYDGADGLVYPGIFLGPRDERVVWGLTYRFLVQFFSLLGHVLPPD